MKRSLSYFIVFAVAGGVAAAQQAKAPAGPAHMIVTPPEIIWGDPPSVLSRKWPQHDGSGA